MSEHQPGPYQLEIPYVIAGLTHYFHVNCDVIGSAPIGTAPASVTMRTKGAGATPLTTSANALWNIIRPFFASATIATTYTLWKFTGTNQDRVFISGGDLTSPGGSDGGANVLSSEAVFTFRSGNGNIGKLQLMESVFTVSSHGPIGTVIGWTTSPIKTYLLGNSCIVLARDRSFPVAALNESFGPSRVTFNKRNRS